MNKLKVEVSAEDHVQGEGSAPVTLVEYGDYECPHCAAAHAVVKRLEHHFGARLRFVFRNFPLSQVHPNAEPAAEAAEFAATHGKFWQMHDSLFRNQSRLGRSTFEELAADLGLDKADLDSAFETQAFKDRIRADFSGGVRSGVNGTPTFFINGQRLDGPADFDYLVNAIEEALRAD